MKCSACDNELTLLFEDIELKGCEECKFLWFTQGQLERIDLMSDTLADFAETTSEVELSQEAICPSCGIPLHFHKYPTAPQVSYPECYNCAGSYLSASQLKEIRENSLNPAQLETYRNQLAHSVEGFTQAEDKRTTRQGQSGFARKWNQFRFWAKDKEDK